MAQVPPPRDLHPTSDIRFVMVELGKFGTRLDSIEGAIDKLGKSIETAVTKLETSLEKQVADLKVDVKQNSKDVTELDKKVSWVKGAAWVLRALGVVLTLVLGAILTAVARKLIG